MKAKLEAGGQPSSGKALKAKTESKRNAVVEEKEEDVILTRTDKHGNTYPLKVSGEEPEPRKKRRKVKAVCGIGRSNIDLLTAFFESPLQALSCAF